MVAEALPKASLYKGSSKERLRGCFERCWTISHFEIVYHASFLLTRHRYRGIVTLTESCLQGGAQFPTGGKENLDS